MKLLNSPLGKLVQTIALVSFLPACSSVLSGSKQSVTILTPGANGAECSLTDSKGRIWYVENTPGTALVKKGDGPISVICKKEGYEMGVGEIGEAVSVATAGNILFPVGFFVDSLTGSGEKYNSSAEIEMEKIVKTDEKKPWEY